MIYIFSDVVETRKNEEIVELVFNECKKENISYRMVALKTLGELLEKLKIDRFAQTYQLVMHIIQKVWFSSHISWLSEQWFIIYIFYV